MQATLRKSYGIKETPEQSGICVLVEAQARCISSKNEHYPGQHSTSLYGLYETVLHFLIKNWLFLFCVLHKIQGVFPHHLNGWRRQE